MPQAARGLNGGIDYVFVFLQFLDYISNGDASFYVNAFGDVLCKSLNITGSLIVASITVLTQIIAPSFRNTDDTFTVSELGALKCASITNPAATFVVGTNGALRSFGLVSTGAVAAPSFSNTALSFTVNATGNTVVRDLYISAYGGLPVGPEIISLRDQVDLLAPAVTTLDSELHAIDDVVTDHTFQIADIYANYATNESISGLLPRLEADATFLKLVDAATTYLTIATASATYATISSLSSYLTTAAAASTYATISSLSSYLTTAAAASTYATISSLSSYLTTASWNAYEAQQRHVKGFVRVIYSSGTWQVVNQFNFNSMNNDVSGTHGLHEIYFSLGTLNSVQGLVAITSIVTSGGPVCAVFNAEGLVQDPYYTKITISTWNLGAVRVRNGFTLFLF